METDGLRFKKGCDWKLVINRINKKKERELG